MRVGLPHVLRTPDHYYWLTAYLAAHDLQRTACRAVAANILALGVIPLVMIAGSGGFHGVLHLVLASGITVGCAAMSGLWLRPSWPSRKVSALSVLFGAVGIATACLIQEQPLVGLVGATTFAVLSAFSVLFHSRAMLLVPWAIGTVTLVVLAVRLSSMDVGLAATGVFLVVLINVFVASLGDIAVRLIDARNPRHSDLEPLTGLLNRDAFHQHIASLMGARSRTDDRYLVVVVINIDSFSLVTGMTGAAGGNRSRVAIGQRLREAIRRDTIVAHVGEAEFLVGELFTTADPSPLVDRLRSAISTAPGRLNPSIGAVSTPLGPLADQPAPEVLDELLDIAAAAMADARRAGGNQTRLVLEPDLAVLNQGSPGDWTGGMQP